MSQATKPDTNRATHRMTSNSVDSSPAQVFAAHLLAALAKAPGQRLEVWQIIANLGLKADSYSRSTLAVRMTRLRKKLVAAGAPEDCLEALRNEGYQLCVAVSVL
mgnify:CR=1 FL=1